jgi:hypothetical protein
LITILYIVTFLSFVAHSDLGWSRLMTAGASQGDFAWGGNAKDPAAMHTASGKMRYLMGLFVTAPRSPKQEEVP